ncbi:MAG: transcriptional regulator [Verrucomicrobiota bacterium]
MSKKKQSSSFQGLEKIFHEPKRLSIVSTVCASSEGLLFTDLKARCDLTDGNLNRHLKVLQDAKVVKIQKTFVDDKPRTTILITQKGLDRFHEYLAALSQVLEQAQESIPKSTSKRPALPLGKLARA